MKIYEMRDALKARFPYKKWTDRVNKMSDGQITATYFRLKRKNNL